MRVSDKWLKELVDIDDTTENIEMIIKKIKDCIENYDNEINKFDNYRQFIKQEKQQFKTDVKQIFEL